MNLKYILNLLINEDVDAAKAALKGDVITIASEIFEGLNYDTEQRRVISESRITKATQVLRQIKQDEIDEGNEGIITDTLDALITTLKPNMTLDEIDALATKYYGATSSGDKGDGDEDRANEIESKLSKIYGINDDGDTNTNTDTVNIAQYNNLDWGEYQPILDSMIKWPTTSGSVFNEIPNPTDEMKKTALSINPDVIEVIKNPTEEMMWTAIHHNPWNITRIKNPTDKMAVYAVSKNPRLFHYIPNPSKDVINQHNKNVDDGYTLSVDSGPGEIHDYQLKNMDLPGVKFPDKNS